MNGANASIATTERRQTLRVSVPRQIPAQFHVEVPRLRQSRCAVLLTQHFNGKTAFRQTASSH